jgi:hypothetical protein
MMIVPWPSAANDGGAPRAHLVGHSKLDRHIEQVLLDLFSARGEEIYVSNKSQIAKILIGAASILRAIYDIIHLFVK